VTCALAPPPVALAEGEPFTADTCAEPIDCDAVLPSPTWAVPMEPLDVFPPEPTIDTGTITVVPASGWVVEDCGELVVEPTCVVPTDPVATLPPAAVDAGTAAATSAAAPMSMRRVIRPLPSLRAPTYRTACSAAAAEMRPKWTLARMRFAVCSIADVTRTLVALGCAAMMIPASPATRGVADDVPQNWP